MYRAFYGKPLIEEYWYRRLTWYILYINKITKIINNTHGFSWIPCCSYFQLCVVIFWGFFCFFVLFFVFCFVLGFFLSSSWVLCTRWYQCLWIVHSGFPLRFSLIFICTGTKQNGTKSTYEHGEELYKLCSVYQLEDKNTTHV